MLVWNDANQQGNPVNLSLVFTEIRSLRQLGILKYLICTDAVHFIRSIYVDMILRYGTTQCQAVLEAMSAELVQELGAQFKLYLGSMLLSELCLGGYFSNVSKRESVDNILSTVGPSPTSVDRRFDADEVLIFNILMSDKILSGLVNKLIC